MSKLPTWRGDAILSECGTYRYLLQRFWNVKLEAVCFVMLNPSTADANINDATIRRCMGFAVDLGFGALEVVNLFAFRSTDPDALKGLAEWRAVGPENNDSILNSAKVCNQVVCAWGNEGVLYGRDQQVLKLLRDAGIKPHALKLSKDGYPGHPLYLKADLKPAPI